MPSLAKIQRSGAQTVTFFQLEWKHISRALRQAEKGHYVNVVLAGKNEPEVALDYFKRAVNHLNLIASYGIRTDAPDYRDARLCRCVWAYYRSRFPNSISDLSMIKQYCQHPDVKSLWYTQHGLRTIQFPD